MNKTLKLAGIMALMGCLAIAACKQDDDDDGSGSTTTTTGTTSTTTDSREDLLTGGNSKSWRVSAYYYDDTLEQIEPCEADDRYTFTKAGKTYLVTFGSTLCDSGETNQTGTWKFIDNNSKFEIDGNYTMAIAELTATKLVFVSYDTIEVVKPGGGTSARVVEGKTIWVSP